MKLLLDTRIFFWLNSQPQKLPGNILATCVNTNNQLVLSHVSPWEIQIKQPLGKMNLDSETLLGGDPFQLSRG